MTKSQVIRTKAKKPAVAVADIERYEKRLGFLSDIYDTLSSVFYYDSSSSSDDEEEEISSSDDDVEIIL